MRVSKLGMVLVATAVLVAIAVLALVAASILPIRVESKVGNPQVVYPNGTVKTLPVVQLKDGGLAVVVFPNGTTRVYNITTPEGTRALYMVVHQIYLAPPKGRGYVVITPTSLKGWISVNKANITLIYDFNGYDVHSKSVKIYFILNKKSLDNINKTAKDLIKYIPYVITVELPTDGNQTGNRAGKHSLAPYITWVGDMTWQGQSILGVNVFTIYQYVEYTTDCSYLISSQAWIQTSGIVGYSFYNEIAIDSQKWSGWGSITSTVVNYPSGTTTSQVNEVTSVYFGLNLGNYGGINGEVASVATLWFLYPSIVYYYTQASGLSPGGGQFTIC